MNASNNTRTGEVSVADLIPFILEELGITMPTEEEKTEQEGTK